MPFEKKWIIDEKDVLSVSSNFFCLNKYTLLNHDFCSDIYSSFYFLEIGEGDFGEVFEGTLVRYKNDPESGKRKKTVSFENLTKIFEFLFYSFLFQFLKVALKTMKNASNKEG